MIQVPDRVGADASALRLRLGEPLRTLAEVGEVLGVAPESVRRLERSALQKLQRDPLALAGAPRQRDRRAAAS